MEEKYRLYNQTSFIKDDPISIPHRFSKKEDIEISGFFAATFSWGRRETIIQKSGLLMEMMDNSPFDFILNSSKKDINAFGKFKHRTFNGSDCINFLLSLKNIYQNLGGLETVLGKPIKNNNYEGGIIENISFFRKSFFLNKNFYSSGRHVSNPQKKSSLKRINMFLRWMVRKDKNGVDFGLWKNLRPYQLLCPLDVHSGNVARKLGILTRKQNDLKAVIELTDFLKKFDAEDPVKYDFALFGLGVFEKF